MWGGGVSALSDMGTKLKQDVAVTEVLFVEPDTEFCAVNMFNPTFTLRPEGILLDPICS